MCCYILVLTYPVLPVNVLLPGAVRGPSVVRVYLFSADWSCSLCWCRCLEIFCAHGQKHAGPTCVPPSVAGTGQSVCFLCQTRRQSTGLCQTRRQSTGLTQTRRQSTGLCPTRRQSTGLTQTRRQSTGLCQTRRQSTGPVSYTHLTLPTRRTV